MLTYHREDAYNQVNNRLNQTSNNRVFNHKASQPLNSDRKLTKQNVRKNSNDIKNNSNMKNRKKIEVKTNINEKVLKRDSENLSVRRSPRSPLKPPQKRITKAVVSSDTNNNATSRLRPKRAVTQNLPSCPDFSQATSTLNSTRKLNKLVR